jgi:GntR family transcriptional regulator
VERAAGSRRNCTTHVSHYNEFDDTVQRTSAGSLSTIRAYIVTTHGNSSNLALVPLDSGRPLYELVKDAIVKGLIDGVWKPQEALPSEARLAERYGVSVPTVRAAITELVAAKVLMRKQGKGTFVASHNHHNVYQFFHMVPDAAPVERPRFRLLSFSRTVASREIAESLALPSARAEQRVCRFRILLTMREEPVMVSDITVAAARMSGLSESVLRTRGDTVYGIYQAEFGVMVTRTKDELRAVLADAGTARRLKIEAGEPVLDLRRVGYTFNNAPVEVRHSRARTDHYHFLLNQGAS